MTYEIDLEEDFKYPGERLVHKARRRLMFRNAYFTAYPEYWCNPEDLEPIFYVGMGRSGTVMLSHILNLCEKVVAYHEPQPRLWHLASRVFMSGDDTKWDDVFWGAKRDLMSVVSSLGFIYSELNGLSSVFMRSMDRLFPKARYIMSLRDIGSFVNSSVNWGWYSENDRNSLGRLQPEDRNMDVASKCAWNWIVINREALKFMDGIPKERKYYLPFSCIRENNLPAIRNIFARFSLYVPSDEEIKETLMDASKRNAKRFADVSFGDLWKRYEDDGNNIYEEFTERVERQNKWL